MSKHTPGPWFVGGSMIGRGNTDADRVSIARVLRRPAVYGGRVQNCPDTEADAPTTGAEADANGRLIATAPDLLSALEDAEFLLRKVGNNPGEVAAMLDSLKRSAKNARAAIAKARGGSDAD